MASALTELEDALDTLLKIMASAIAYQSRKAGHRQVDPDVPLTTLGNTEGLSDEALAASRDELVHDLIAQAKDVERRIAALPVPDEDDDAQVRRWTHPGCAPRHARARHPRRQCRVPCRAGGRTYVTTLTPAGTLQAQLRGALERLSHERQAARHVLDHA